MGQQPLSRKVYVSELTDISTASISYVPIMEDGKIVKVRSVIHGAITGAPAIVTVKRIRAGASTVSMGTITVTHTSSAAGDVDDLTPVSNNNVLAGDVLAFDSDGASSTAIRATFAAVLETAP